MKQLFTIILAVILMTLVARSDYEFEFGGNSYKIVTTEMSWEDAANAAVETGGRLVHIDNEEEQNAIYSEIENSGISTDYKSVMDGGGIAYIWIGATDKNEEGTWLWDGDNDNEGTNFWTGQGENGDNDGEAIDDSYQNWGGNSQDGNANEPDDFQNSQDAAAIALEAWPKGMGFLGQASEWNDINLNNELYYIIEYDGTTKVNFDKSTNEILITPNPVTNELRIDNVPTAEGSEIMIYNFLGEKVISLSQSESELRIDVSALQTGMYFIKIGNKVEKFVKK